MINIQLQTLLLIMMLNYLKDQEKIITVSLHQVPKNLQEQHQQINHLGETFICQSKNSLHQENNIHLSKRR